MERKKMSKKTKIISLVVALSIVLTMIPAMGLSTLADDTKKETARGHEGMHIQGPDGRDLNDEKDQKGLKNHEDFEKNKVTIDKNQEFKDNKLEESQKDASDLILKNDNVIEDTLKTTTQPIKKIVAGEGKYIDKFGEIKRIPSNATEITDSTTEIGTGSASPNMWYIVKSTITNGNRIEVKGTANIILTDGSDLNATEGGIHVGKGNTLNIFAQSTRGNTGKLEAGNYSQNSGNAGIGGNCNSSGDGEDCGTVGIYGGIITAESSHGAGIGGGEAYANNNAKITGGAGGKITINNATVTAKSYDGAGIGGGCGYVYNYNSFATGGDGGTITITNSTVTAESYDGAGIGGGCGGVDNANGSGTGGDGGTITITNSTVTAKSYYGAGIGGGDGWIDYSGSGTGGDGGTITITNSTVTAESSYGAGIGGGEGDLGNDSEICFSGSGTGGAGGTITITNSTVTAESSYGAGIGGGLGSSWSSGSGTGGNGGTITITNSTVTAKSYDGAGIGGGEGYVYYPGSSTGGNGGTITITNSTVTAKSSDGAGIGGGCGYNYDYGSGTGGNGGTITITNSTVTAKSDGGAGIGGGKGYCYYCNSETGGDGGTITITNSIVTAKSDTAACIGGGDGYFKGESANITLHKNLYGQKPLVKNFNGENITNTSGNWGTTLNECNDVIIYHPKTVTYRDKNQKVKTCDNYIIVNDATASTVLDIEKTEAWSAPKWYVVMGSTNLDSRIEINGTANMILADDSYLYARLGIHVGEGKTLNIFAQSTGKHAGKLIAGNDSADLDGNGTAFQHAGIGGNDNGNGYGENCGTVGICGGIINALSNKGAGIGGGYGNTKGGNGGTLNIFNGIINASSVNGVSIGGVNSGEKTNITLRKCAVVKKSEDATENITLTGSQTWGEVIQKESTIYINAYEHQWIKRRRLLLTGEECAICGAIR